MRMDVLCEKYPGYRIQKHLSACTYCKQPIKANEVVLNVRAKQRLVRFRPFHSDCRTKYRHQPRVIERNAKRRKTTHYAELTSQPRYVLNGLLSDMYGRIRKNPQKYGPHDVDIDHLLHLYHSQAESCAICRRTFDLKAGRSPDSVSLDRIDSSVGYRKNNVHLVCVLCNYGKHEYSLQEFKDAFAKGLHTPMVRVDDTSIRSHLRPIVTSARRRRPHNFELTLDVMIAKAKSQMMRCYYTGIPLLFAPHDAPMYKASIDRMDSSKGYTIGNSVLCCRFFNYYKNVFTPDDAVRRWKHARCTLDQERTSTKRA